jgi:hypothetical protein
LNKLQPESCPCTQESISKKNHGNRAKNGKIFTVEFAQKASQPPKISPTFGTERWFKKTGLVLSITKDAPAPRLQFHRIVTEIARKMVNFSL